MLASGAFIYCTVLVVQGTAAQLLPRRLFLRISGYLQLAAFCLFLCGYFLQPSFGGLEGLSVPAAQRLVFAVPSFWFLGLFHQLNGSMHPALVPLAHRAWWGLAIALGGTATAYALSYMRTLRKIVEEPEITPGARRAMWLPPFGSRLQTAIGQFSIRTLVRSRQHRVILAFYLGIGFAITIFLLKAPELKERLPGGADPWRRADTPLLAASIAMLTLAIVGTRVVFAMPLELRANWIFRVIGMQGGTRTLTAARRALMLTAALPLCSIAAVLCLWLWPLRQAAGHVALLALLAILLTDLCLLGFRKVPFACSYLPGKSPIHLLFLGALGLMHFILLNVKLERQMLQSGRDTLWMLLPFAVAAVGLRIYVKLTRDAKEELQFEEAIDPAVMELGLTRDGVLPIVTPPESTGPLYE
jgi:hypothetical protein